MFLLKEYMTVERRILYRPPPLHHSIVTLFLDLDLDLRILVGYFEYPEFLCIDKPLQGQHIAPVHTFEIITLIGNFTHIFTTPEKV